MLSQDDWCMKWIKHELKPYEIRSWHQMTCVIGKSLEIVGSCGIRMSHTLVFSYGDKRARNSSDRITDLNSKWFTEWFRFTEYSQGQEMSTLCSMCSVCSKVISRGSGAEASRVRGIFWNNLVKICQAAFEDFEHVWTSSTWIFYRHFCFSFLSLGIQK